MSLIKKMWIILMFFGLFACNNTKEKSIIVTNSLPFARKSETVEVSKKMLGISSDSLFNSYGIVDAKTGNTVVYQLYDKNGDGKDDVILFQPVVPADGQATYIAKVLLPRPHFVSKVYSRFVPERTDDYAWENDRVAFRTFGPTAERMVEQHIPGGTLTSGIDCWMKKVNYLIINKWYKNDLSKKESYHIDHGEGFDNYHVGASRGCGGLGIWKDDTLWTSRNFSSWKRLANGPLRTAFVLKYKDWRAGETVVSEKQLVTLDAGSNLTRFEVEITHTPIITVGITLHEAKGKITGNPEKGWFSYMEKNPEHHYAIWTAIWANPEDVLNYKKYISGVPDHSHLLVNLRVKNHKVVYYSGFSWTKSGQFNGKKGWEAYLTKFAEEQQHPLSIKMTH